MRWADQAIILSIHKFGENGGVVKLFSREQGVSAGAVRNAFSKANCGIYQPGNIVQAVWSARLEDQLGTLHSEMDEPVAALLLQDSLRLSAMSSALALVEIALAEHDPHPQLYDHLYYLLQRLRYHLPWQEDYVLLELTILAESGFGLELDSCAATGVRENLVYVSPKSGRAVCAEAGKPYAEKLLRIPDFSHPEGVNDGLRLSGYFLEHRLLESHHRKMPAARQRLAKSLQAVHIM